MKKHLIFLLSTILAVLPVVAAQEIDAGRIAFIGGIVAVVVTIVSIALYVYVALALMTIATKTRTKNAWFAWIPFLNLYLMTQVAKVPWWTMFAFVLAIIPFIGFLACAAVGVWWFWKIAERRDRPGWWSLLLLIPLVNLVILGVLAWGEA